MPPNSGGSEGSGGSGSSANSARHALVDRLGGGVGVLELDGLDGFDVSEYISKRPESQLWSPPHAGNAALAAFVLNL